MAKYGWHIDFDDQTPVAQPGPTPRCQHTPCPSGYGSRAVWMTRMAKTHRQRRCPHCGLWAIWEPRTR